MLILSDETIAKNAGTELPETSEQIPRRDEIQPAQMRDVWASRWFDS